MNDIIGYIGYIFCFAGWLILSHQFRLSMIFNLIGGLITILYGIIIDAMPVIVFNIIWTVTAVYNLKKGGKKYEKYNRKQS